MTVSNKLLLDRFPDVLQPQQKQNKVRSLLQALRHEGLIEAHGKE